jgi:small subunit ribosomal protein S5
MLRAAPPGTGIIAGGPMRAVFETLGVQDVVAKSSARPTPTTWSAPPSTR